MNLLRDDFRPSLENKYVLGLIGHNDGKFYPQAWFETHREALDEYEQVKNGRNRVPWVLVRVEFFDPATDFS